MVTRALTAAIDANDVTALATKTLLLRKVIRLAPLTQFKTLINKLTGEFVDTWKQLDLNDEQVNRNLGDQKTAEDNFNCAPSSWLPIAIWSW